MKNLLFFVFLLTNYFAIAQTPTLPSIQLRMASNDLSSLNSNSNADKLYPAQVLFNGKSYACLVRYRGATARFQPKKSWKIKFLDGNNPWKVNDMNLSADYRDVSLMRNLLTCKLFQFMGSNASNVEHIYLTVNEKQSGVYTMVEEIDENYSKRTNSDMSCLFKTRQNHAAIRLPFQTFEKMTYAWSLKLGNDYKQMQELDSKILFYSNTDFEKYIETDINVDNWLNYFAIENTVCNNDAYSKNMFVHRNNTTKVFEVTPWDNDATFGNMWDGNYWYGSEKNKGIIMYNYLFWRLMQYPKYRQIFNQKVNKIINEGFSYLNQVIDSTYQRIKNEVYLDTRKKGSNKSFEAGIKELKSFMTERKSTLNGFQMWDKAQFSDINVSTIYPNSKQTSLAITVKSNIRTDVTLRYAFSAKLPLYDDGQHNDGKAGDLIYGNTLPIGSNNIAIPIDFVNANLYHCRFDTEDFSRFNAVQSLRTIYRSNLPLPSTTNLQIGNVMKTSNGEYFVEIRNISSTNVDVSYCFLQNKYFENFMFPPRTVIAPNTTLLISSYPMLSNILLNKKYPHTIGDLFFEIALNDELKFVTPDLKSLISKKVSTFDALPQRANPKVVINEINYASASNRYTDDWIELYNPSNSNINISGYLITDKEYSHHFIVPNGVTIAPNGYIIIAKNTNYFKKYFPSAYVVGNLGFGLGGNDVIRVYDTNNQLVDSVAYRNRLPWTPKANGTGATLVLRSPDLDNSLPENWTYSLGYGSPAKKNLFPAEN